MLAQVQRGSARYFREGGTPRYAVLSPTPFLIIVLVLLSLSQCLLPPRSIFEGKMQPALLDVLTRASPLFHLDAIDSLGINPPSFLRPFGLPPFSLWAAQQPREELVLDELNSRGASCDERHRLRLGYD